MQNVCDKYSKLADIWPRKQVLLNMSNIEVNGANSGQLGPRTTRPKTTWPVSPYYSALCCNYVNIILIKNTLKCRQLFIT